MSLSVTNFGVMRGQHNATVLRRRTKYVHVVFVDSTSLRTVSRYISLNQFTVFHPEEKYLDMSWPLSLISDVVLFKFSPVKNINSSEILFWYHTAEYTGQNFLLPSCLCNPLV